MNLHDEIAKVAHELYERSGCVAGCDRENWLEAERIVKARLAQKSSGPATEGPEKKPKKKQAGQASLKKTAGAKKTPAKRSSKTK